MRIIYIFLISTCSSFGQWTPYMQQLLQKPNAPSAKAWLQIKEVVAGSNVVFTTDPFGNTIINASGGGGGGSGTVTSFSAGNANPLFTTSVATATTTPKLTFTLSYIPIANTPTITNEMFASNIVGVISPSTSGALSNHNDVSASPNSGDILIWSGSIWTNGPQVGITAGVASVTNAGIGQASLITSSNAPIPSFKSISAGANVTITDNGTNLNIASSGGGGSSLTDLLQYQTNNMVTLRTVASDVSDASATVFTGVGDTLSFSFNGGSGANTTFHALGGAPTGLWCEFRCNGANNANDQLSSQTVFAVPPYPGYGLTYQIYLCVRNTNATRIIAGAEAADIEFAGNSGTPTNLIVFRYDTSSNDLTWHGVVSDGTNMSFVDTGVQLTNDGQYYLGFTKSGTNVTFNVNHANVATVSSNTVPNSFNRTGESMAVFYGLQTLNTSPKTNLLRYTGYAFGWPNK